MKLIARHVLYKWGNMRKLDAEEVKKIQIEILDYVDDFCRKNDMNYWLDSGSLIGAVRHKGFIPWDDDIDIGMLRPDYEKFLKVFNKNNSKYKVSSVEIDENCAFPYGKIFDTATVLYEPDERGIKSSIGVDLFIYDNAPDDDKIVEKMYKKRDRYNKCRFIQNYKFYRDASIKHIAKNIIVGLKKIFLLPFPKKYFVKKVAENSKRYANVETIRVGNFTALSKFACPKECFDSFTEVEFEGKTYKAPINYDMWLTYYYGDYMKLPPIEKQVSHHEFVAYIED